jgi:hypothetical protein
MTRALLNIVSTGDPAKDQEILDGFERRSRLLAQNLCPNGHGQLRLLNEYERECTVCRFHNGSNTPILAAYAQDVN